MHAGSLISALGHGAVLGWLVFGNVFRAEPLPMNVQEVAVISTAQFNAMRAPQLSENAPEVVTEIALPIPTPPEEEPSEATPSTPQDDAVEAPELPSFTPPETDSAILAPEVSENPTPPVAPRVAPEPLPEPETEAAPAEEVQEAVDENAPGDETDPAPEATAPEAATTELVTEADTPTAAPTRSIRPPTGARPKPPVRQAEAPTPPAELQSDPVAEALAEALSQPSAPTGPPLTGSEREGLRVAVASCWNVGALSTAAQETKVTVYVRMNRDGKPDRSSIKMLGFTGGTEGSARRVFDSARRAIIRCGSRGFPLPAEKYGQWQEIEMTFNPEGMFWR